jgi:hypothetical protein
MDEFDQIATGLNRISLLAQLRDKVAIAQVASRTRCGDCQHWMKSRSCPAERNVGGMSRGPSADAPTCGKFAIASASIALRNQRIEEAVAFAKNHGLPIPEGLAL